MIALSQKGNTCIQVIFTQSSVSMTTTSECLPVSGFNVPSLHLPQSSRLHPFQVSQKQTATIQATKVIPDLPATLNNCASSRQKHENRLTIKVSCFVKSHKTVSTSYTIQAVSNDSMHAPFKRIHNCNSKPRMLPDASEKSKPTFPNRRCLPVTSLSQSVVNQQSQHQVPSCLQCHDGSYFLLSLSQHSSA